MTDQMSTEELVDLLGPWEAKQLAGSILSEYGDQGSELVGKLLDRVAEVESSREESDGREVDPDEATYVPDVWTSRPVYHRLKNRDHLMTTCGHAVSFRQKSILLPLRLAERIGHTCGICFPPTRARD